MLGKATLGSLRHFVVGRQQTIRSQERLASNQILNTIQLNTCYVCVRLGTSALTIEIPLDGINDPMANCRCRGDVTVYGKRIAMTIYRP